MADTPRIEDLKRRVQSDPASIAFAALAEEYRRAGQFEEAIAVCTAGLVRHPSYLSAHVTLGRALIEVGRFDAAKEELEYVLQPRAGEPRRDSRPRRYRASARRGYAAACRGPARGGRRRRSGRGGRHPRDRRAAGPRDHPVFADPLVWGSTPTPARPQRRPIRLREPR